MLLFSRTAAAQQTVGTVRGVVVDADFNLPLPGVPDGDASANRVLRAWGTAPAPAFTPVPHWDLGQALGLFDLPRGAKIAGSGFPLFTGPGARLVRALGIVIANPVANDPAVSQTCHR